MQEIMKKKIILGTSDAWSMSFPAYYIEDCRISNYHSIQFITANTEDGFYHFVASKQNTSNGCAKSGSYLGQNFYEIALHGIFKLVFTST